MKTTRTFLFISMLTLFAVPGFAQNIERMFQTDVKIYLQQFGAAPNGAADLGLRPVERMVPNDFKLDYALEALFSEEITDEEEEAEFHSSTYGMKLEGVSLKAGTVTVRFSQPPGRTEFIGIEPRVFVEAITKTAKQFKFVRRVTICAVGKTTIDSELEPRPFPRCPAKR